MGDGSSRSPVVSVHTGDALGRYGFGGDHPFGADRLHAFWDEMYRRHLDFQVRILEPVQANIEDLLKFHDRAYVDRVKQYSDAGEGMLDYGDTPAYPGVFEAASAVVGSVLDATHRIMRGDVRRAFVPIAGLHHGQPGTAAGFCVFNDCGVVLRILRESYGLERVAYVDIDAHHGDGVFYPFEDDPAIVIADIHEDGRYNFPNTGFEHETGKGKAIGTKLNVPLLPGSKDAEFRKAWERVEAFLEGWKPQFIVFQCGADGLVGDPLAHLLFSNQCHHLAATRLCRLAERHAKGRILATGGGGYDLRNVGKAWTAVIDAFLHAPM